MEWLCGGVTILGLVIGCVLWAAKRSARTLGASRFLVELESRPATLRFRFLEMEADLMTATRVEPGRVVPFSWTYSVRRLDGPLWQWRLRDETEAESMHEYLSAHPHIHGPHGVVMAEERAWHEVPEEAVAALETRYQRFLHRRG